MSEITYEEHPEVIIIDTAMQLEALERSSGEDLSITFEKNDVASGLLKVLIENARIVREKREAQVAGLKQPISAKYLRPETIIK